MTQNVALLSDRGVIKVDGPDAEKFLQGLLTNAIDKAIYIPETHQTRAVFSGLLTPQGKILFDFIIIRTKDNHFLLDVASSLINDLIKRLNFYKLRAQVRIQDLRSEYSVIASWTSGTDATVSTSADSPINRFADPRLNQLGLRFIMPSSEINSVLTTPTYNRVSEQDYHAHRIASAVPEGGKDYVYGDTFPHEACYDLLNGVDFKKGCYVGQEVVSRMQHRGTARKRIVKVSAPSSLPCEGTDIISGEQVIGRMGSNSRATGLALVRLDRAAKAQSNKQIMTSEGIPLTLTLPEWASYSFEAGSAED